MCLVDVQLDALSPFNKISGVEKSNRMNGMNGMAWHGMGLVVYSIYNIYIYNIHIKEFITKRI